jgi:hypothetical protein
MSENIESNVIQKHTKGYGNQSTFSIKDKAVSNIARNGNGEFI